MLTKCPNPNCDSRLFEMVLGEPRGSRFKVWFVQCAICGTAINAMEYLSIGPKLNDIEEKVSTLENNLLSIQRDIQNTQIMIQKIINTDR